MQLQNRSIPIIWLAVSLPTAVFLISIFLVTSSAVVMNQQLATGITLDLVATAPLIFFLLIRKSDVPNITVVPVFILGFVIASLIIPKEFASVRDVVGHYFIPVLEVAIISLLIYRIRDSARKAKSAVTSADTYSFIKESAFDLLKNRWAANVVSTEAAMIYYSLVAWRNPPIQDNDFTVHRESSARVVFSTVIFIILAETVVLHFILIKWNMIVAWVVFALSMYTALQFLAHVSALKRRVITIEADSLYVRYGLFAEAKIPIMTIQRIELTSSEVADSSRKVGKLALLSPIEDHNVILYLGQPVAIEKIYGLKAEVDTLTFHVDDRDQFADRLRLMMTKTGC